jgi:hypothetical protein
MRATDLYESAATELARKLPSLEKHDYNTIDKLMRGIAKKHRITGKALHDLFVKEYKKTPDSWIKNKLDESEQEDLNDNPIVQKFISWTAQKLNLEKTPKIEFSYDSDEAQEGHHTGRHNPSTGEVWVYCANRNLVDILRTVFHELTHVRQGELNMIKPGDSYPGSPIEAEADMMAGKYMKIFGKAHPEIFQ